MLVLAMAAASVFMLWLNMVSDPMQARIANTESRINNLTTQIAQQQASYAEKLVASEDDPNRFANDRLQVVAQELEALEGEIASLAGDLVTPAEMTQILTTLLSEQAGLEFITFENEDAIPLQSGIAANEATLVESDVVVYDEFGQAEVQGQVFEHGLILEFQGSFFDTLRYLRFLEQINGNFFWDTITFQQMAWPNAHVTLEIHTLSTDRGFIGV